MAQPDPSRRIGAVLGRGLRCKCPRCGEGPLFRRWIETHERCSSCRLLFQRNYGDIWMFMLVLDRIPILFGIAVVYFGFRATNALATIGFAAAMAIPLIATMRNRQGVALALDYLSRVYFPDPSDEIHGGVEMSESEARARQKPEAARGEEIVQRLRGTSTVGMSTDEIMALTRR